MNPEQLFSRYEDFLTYVGWTETDGDNVRTAAGVLIPQLQGLIDDFYTTIQSHVETRRLIADENSSMRRLKEFLLGWLQELLSGPYDRDYLARRWLVGKRHVDVGLEQTYVNGAMARLRVGLFTTLDRFWQGDKGSLVQTILSLNKLLDLDRTIIEAAYDRNITATCADTSNLQRWDI